MQISAITLIILLQIIQNCFNVLGVIDKPEFLWSAVNSSLTEKKAPRHCAKVIFYNNHTFANPDLAKSHFNNESQSEIVPNSFINIDEYIFRGISEEWQTAEENLKIATELSINDKLEPCVTVVSFVHNSIKYNMSELNFRTPPIRHLMADLLQHSTPVRSRHLVLIRISRNLDEFRFCTKAAKYPLRLVPHWEMLLFDFFTDVRVIQGLFFENGEEKHPYVRISKENGRWKWLCEDTILNLEIEKSCNMDQTCLDAHRPPDLQIWKPGIGFGGKNCSRGFYPRH